MLAAVACSSPPPERQPADDGTETTRPPATTAPDTSGRQGEDGADGSASPQPSVPLQEPEAFDGPVLDDDEVSARLAELEGQLAIGDGPALAVGRPDGGALRLLGDGRELAAQATWSRDGTSLAWSSASATRRAVLVQDFDDEGAPDGEPGVSEVDGSPVFYLQWDRDDRRLAYLRPVDRTGLIEFGLLEPGAPAEPLDTGAPYFLAWAPGSARLLTHADQESLRLRDVKAGIDPAAEPATVLDRGGGYSAPAWVDDRRALVVDDGSLVIVTVADGTVEPVEPLDGPVAFVLSPDGRRVAYRHLPGLGDDTLEASLGAGSGEAGEPVGDDQLVVFDLDSGERELVTDEGAVAWEWSPDGSRLAWLSLDQGPRLTGRWHFWSADGTRPGTDRTPAFALTRTYAEAYLPFFAQYAQSVTGWAPDSSAFAFAGTVGSGRGVWVQLVDDPAPVRLVAGGDIVTWGPGPTPEPRLGPSAA